MKLDTFRNLCSSTYERGGEIRLLHLVPDSLAELTRDVVREAQNLAFPGGVPEGAAGLRLTSIINPTTGAIVQVELQSKRKYPVGDGDTAQIEFLL